MIHNLLVLPDGTELSAGVPGQNALRSLQWTHTLNNGTDLTPGSACADSIEAEIWVEPGRSPGIREGEELTLYRVGEDGTRTRAGIFVAESPTRGKRNLYRLTAYDRMVLTERDLSPWLRELQGEFPMTLDAFVQRVAEACGVPLAGMLPRNGDYSVRAFYADSLTGRQLLQWAAQAAGCYVHCDAAGALVFGWYQDSRGRQSLVPGADAIDPQLGTAVPYRQDGLSYEEYQTASIDKVQVRQSDSDVGVIYPAEETGTNALVIQGNLLLTAEQDEDLRPVAQALYEAAAAWPAYTPCTVSAFGSCPVTAGQWVYVVTPGGQRLETCVMTAVFADGETRLESTGNPRRDSVAAVNSSRLNLTGKLLEIKTSIDGLNVKASDLAGDYSELKQSVDSLSLGVTAQNVYQDIRGQAPWVEVYGGAVEQEDEVTLTGSEQECGASVYVPEENLAGLAGKRLRITLDYKVDQVVGGAACEVILWRTYQGESVGGLYVRQITTGSDVAVMPDWEPVEWETTLAQKAVAELHFYLRLRAGAHGAVRFRGLRIEAVHTVESSVSLSKDGVTVSTASLGQLATAADYTALKLEQGNLSLTVVKDGEVRSKFAADDSSVTISSGQITFAANTLVVDSDNFKLKEDGTVQITGTFTSEGSVDRAYIGSGQLHLERKTNDGVWRPTIYGYSDGANAALGHLRLYGPADTGNQIPMVALNSGFSGGEFWLYYANGKPMFQATPGSNGGPYFSLINSSWQSIGNWRMDDDGRGHLTTPIVELEKLKADGVSYTAQWVYMSSLGRYVLCAK